MSFLMDKNYRELAREARIKIITMIHKAQTSHVASNFSAVDIAVVLYNNLKEGDEVVWSAGWKAALIYRMLAKQGKIPVEDLEKFGKEIDGKIPYLGLAETSTPGVHVSGGAMGHGLPVAVGMALAKKKSREKGIIYCIMSDGEMQEGTTWEAAQMASHHKLNNLVVLVDYNKWCAMGKTNEVINLEPFEDRWMGFGWKVQRIDGHNYEHIEEALTTDFTELNMGETGIMTPNIVDYQYKYKPMVIICDTIKGKGVSFIENPPEHATLGDTGHLYHYKSIDEEKYNLALKELEKR